MKPITLFFFFKERDRESTVPTIHQLKPAISPKLSAAEWLPEVLLLWGCLENEHLGRPELLIGGGNDIKCHNAPFQIKTCPDFSGRGGRGENGPKYLRNDCIFLFLNSYYILPGKLVTSKVSSPSRCCLESSIRHSWPSSYFILLATGARQALLLFQWGKHTGTKCLSPCAMGRRAGGPIFHCSMLSPD